MIIILYLWNGEYKMCILYVLKIKCKLFLFTFVNRQPDDV